MSNIKQSWWQLAGIQIGGAICLPVIMVGQVLAQQYGFISALVALFIGNILLFFLALTASEMTWKNPVNTVENATNYFGQKGKKFLAITMILCMVAWFAIQLNLMSLSLYDALKTLIPIDLNLNFINFILGVLITLVALKGIQSIDKLSRFAMPLLIITLGYAVYKVFIYSQTNNISYQNVPLTFGGISLTIATSIAVIVDLPTYYRFAKSKFDSVLSIGILFLIAIPLIEFVGVYIGSYNPQSNIVATLTSNGGWIWQLWVGLFLLFAGWTTNNANLYSGAVSLESIIPTLSEPSRIMIVGIIGTVLSFFNLLEKFEIVIDGMGVIITSMAAVILTRFISNLLFKKTLATNFIENIISWAIGIFFGLLSLMNYLPITGLSVIDAWLAASISTVILELKNVCYSSKKIESTLYEN